jgi:hypothetical protein
MPAGHRATTDIATSARPLTRAHVKRAAATIVPEVRDVYDCNLETRSETDLRMSALRARGGASSRAEIEPALVPGSVCVLRVARGTKPAFPRR